MFIMYDATDLSQIPKNPHAVACYIDGKYKNDVEARRVFPHARILTISTGSGVAADCYDIERGDHTPGDIVRLYDVAIAGMIWRPCFYADLSNMPAVKARLNEAGIVRDHVRLWVASWDGVTIVPAGYDAKQFTDKALARNLDESVCLDTFFRPGRLPSPHTVDTAVVTYDRDDRTWGIKPGPLGSEVK